MNINAMPDGNSAAELNYDLACQRDMERQDRLREQYPLEDFEEAAWQEFSNPGNEHVADLFDTHPDATVQALARYCGLSRGFYTTSDLQITKDQQRVAGWIETRIAEIMERLREEAIEDAS